MTNHKQIIVAVLFFAALATSLLILVSASTDGRVLLEAENVEKSLAQADELASNGSFIEFKGDETVSSNPADAYDHKNVLYVAADGNDSAAGAKETPFKTIQKAVDSAAPDTLIRVQPGTYRQNISLDGKTNLTIVGDSMLSEKPHIIGSNYAVAHITNTSYTTIDNLMIEATPKAGKEDGWGSPIGVNSQGANGDVHHITIRNNELIGHDASPLGIQMLNNTQYLPVKTVVLDYFLIEDNVIHGKGDQYLASKFAGGGSAISMFAMKEYDQKPGPHNIIRRNFIYQVSQTVASTHIGSSGITDGNGIIFDLNNVHNYNARSDVYLNVIVDVGGSGMHAYTSSQEVNFFNNTIVNYGTSKPGTFGIGTESDKQRAWNNLIIGGPKKHLSIKGPAQIGVNLAFQTGAGTHTLNLDPLLPDAFTRPYEIEKFIPEATSPAYTNGEASFGGIDSPTVDFFGNTSATPWLGAIAPN